MKTRYIDPVKELGPLLLGIEKPARYTGGEYGHRAVSPMAHNDTMLKTLIAFPDLYEIGMSNHAFRILYNRINELDGGENIFCDRAFAPAPDFEQLLKDRSLPLYGLDTGISLKDLDLLMFTLGYELGITGVFSMLGISGIPLRCRDRGADDPLLIMGGPCVSNPLPYAAFIDAFWIGEAEAGFFNLVRELADIKKSGGKRKDLLEKLVSHKSVWTNGKGRTLRAVDINFPLSEQSPAVFPVPSMKVVHQHGAVEIMRGCPNGCRFCHAGYWYRPMRQKSAAVVVAETEAFIHRGGYREISLSSLSSGDYQYLDSLIDKLNERFQGQRISFQLPSLRVSGFSLDLLEKISEVRKSGLTFAIETPADFWQMAINKKVHTNDIVSILREARRRGWRGAKFYFMIGLPLDCRNDKKCAQESHKSEEEEIAEFVERIAKQTGMNFNINVGTFVPKAHTPFQWAAQMDPALAERKLNYLRVRLKAQGHKVGIQDPLFSIIEGIASRGDERAGEIFEEAYHSGCRLDSWTEYSKRDVWKDLLGRNEDLVKEILGAKDPGGQLPWSTIGSGLNHEYLKNELMRSTNRENTLICMEKCNNPCGICSSERKIVKNNIQLQVNSREHASEICTKKKDPDTHRIVFSFSKQGRAVFLGHLSLLEVFSMAFVRSGLPVLYSRGFNPLPRLDIACPLPVGISACGEIAGLDMEEYIDAGLMKTALNSVLPDGLALVRAMNFCIPSGKKKHSVSSLLWGCQYAGKDGEPCMVRAEDEKAYRTARSPDGKNIYGLERLSVLARPLAADQSSMTAKGLSYFEVYSGLYVDTGAKKHHTYTT